MNDNEFGDERLRELLTAANIRAGLGTRRRWLKAEPPVMPENKTKIERPLHVHIAGDAALVVGNEAPVTVQVGSKRGPAVSVDDLERVGEMISSIAESRGVEEAQIRLELARHLHTRDLSFLSGSNVGDALEVLSEWQGDAIPTAIGDSIRTRRQ